MTNLSQFTVDQLLVIVKKNRDCLRAINETPISDRDMLYSMKADYQNEIAACVKEINAKLRQWECYIVWLPLRKPNPVPGPSFAEPAYEGEKPIL